MSTAPSLPAEITIYNLASLQQEWLQWLNKVPKPRRASAKFKAWPVDASGVDEIDASGVQLLLSLSHALTARQRSLQLVNPSRPLASACHALGLSQLLASDQKAEIPA